MICLNKLFLYDTLLKLKFDHAQWVFLVTLYYDMFEEVDRRG